jgi:hypothetical protein
MARYKKTKELNLLTALDRGKRRRRPGNAAIAIIVLIVAMGAAATFFYIHTADETDKLVARRDAALSYVDNPETKAQYKEAVANLQRAQEAQDRADGIVGAAEAINTYPDMTGGDYEKLFGIAGKKVDLSNITYDRTTGILNFDAMCRSAERIPTFIASLRSCGIFSDVYYEGYSGGAYTISEERQSEEDGSVIQSQTTVNEYSFSVTCLVTAGEQREDADAAPDDANSAGEAANDQ